MYDICTIAHITKDVNTTPKGVKKLPGGTAFYFASALENFPIKHKLITKLSFDDHHLIKSLNPDHVLTINSNQSHFFENIYYDYSDNREQRVHSLAEPFTVDDTYNIQSSYFHLGPLSKYDTPIGLLKYLRTRGKVSIDVQGLLRDIIDNKVVPSQWEEKEEALKYIDIIKVNEDESEMLTGKKDLEEAALYLSAYGIDEIVLTYGTKGSLIYANEQFHPIPVYKPKSIVDATGCGDTYMAGYLYQRSKGQSVIQSGKFAAAMAAIKIENFGPFRGTEKEIIDLVRE